MMIMMHMIVDYLLPSSFRTGPLPAASKEALVVPHAAAPAPSGVCKNCTRRCTDKRSQPTRQTLPINLSTDPPAAGIPPGEVTPTNADATRKRRRSFLRAIDDKDDARERDIRAKKAARRPDPHQRFVDILWGSRSVDLRARC